MGVGLLFLLCGAQESNLSLHDEWKALFLAESSPQPEDRLSVPIR